MTVHDVHGCPTAYPWDNKCRVYYDITNVLNYAKQDVRQALEEDPEYVDRARKIAREYMGDLDKRDLRNEYIAAREGFKESDITQWYDSAEKMAVRVVERYRGEESEYSLQRRRWMRAIQLLTAYWFDFRSL